MGTKFSSFTSQTSFGATDEVVGLVGGANSRLTRKVLLQGTGTPADGQILRYNANLATPTYETIDPRWRVLALGTDYTAAPPTTSTITVTAATVAAAPAGTPVRFKVGGSALYGIVTISTGTTLTISGPSISATLTELCLGTPEMVKHAHIVAPVTYGAQTTQMTGGQWIWLGPPASIVAYQMQASTVYATTKPVVQVRVNASGTYVSSSGLTITAANTIYTPTAATYSSTGYAVTYGQVIEPWVPTTAGTGTAGTYLMVDLALVIN